MKKQTIYTIVLLCATAFCGCTVTTHVTSYNAFSQAVEEVNKALEKEGFTLESIENSSKRDIPLSSRAPQPYSYNEHGFHESTTADVEYADTYRFVNNVGETMSYAVSYRTGIDLQKSMAYVREAYVSGCETSNPTHHDRLCGEHSPIYRLNSLEKDTTAVL